MRLARRPVLALVARVRVERAHRDVVPRVDHVRVVVEEVALLVERAHEELHTEEAHQGDDEDEQHDNVAEPRARYPQGDEDALQEDQVGHGAVDAEGPEEPREPLQHREWRRVDSEADVV